MISSQSDSSLRDRLTAGATTLGVALDDATVDQLMQYLEILGRWNRKFNLTAIREPQRIVTEHFLDALSIADSVQGQRVIDVGTGAGFPGLVLAIVAPQRQAVLLDANGKKTRFLREVVRQLGLDHVAIHEGRSEDYHPEAGFDTVMCRAFAPLPRLIDVASHLLAPDGLFLAQKGQYPAEEVAALGNRWHIDSAELNVPGLAKTRHVLTLQPRPSS